MCVCVPSTRFHDFPIERAANFRSKKKERAKGDGDKKIKELAIQ
jgi:hypothetical protein